MFSRKEVVVSDVAENDVEHIKKKTRQACRYLVINSGTSKSPEFTRQRDKYASGGPGRPGPPWFWSPYGAQNLRSPMTDAFSYALYFACGKTSGPKATRDYSPAPSALHGSQRLEGRRLVTLDYLDTSNTGLKAVFLPFSISTAFINFDFNHIK